MNTRALIFFGLSLILLVITAVFFVKSLNIKTLMFFISGLATALLFRIGLKEIQKNKNNQK